MRSGPSWIEFDPLLQDRIAFLGTALLWTVSPTRFPLQPGLPPTMHRELSEESCVSIGPMRLSLSPWKSNANLLGARSEGAQDQDTAAEVAGAARHQTKPTDGMSGTALKRSQRPSSSMHFKIPFMCSFSHCMEGNCDFFLFIVNYELTGERCEGVSKYLHYFQSPRSEAVELAWRRSGRSYTPSTCCVSRVGERERDEDQQN